MASLMSRKNKKFKDDELVKMFDDFRAGRTSYEDYILQIANVFSAKEVLADKLEEMKMKIQPKEVNPKFNHIILKEWYPKLGPNDAGRLYGKLKSKFSGKGEGA